MRTPSSSVPGLALAALLIAPGAGAAALSLAGGQWFEFLGAVDVAAGAGGNLPTAIESSAAVALLSVYDTAGQGWTLSVQLSGASLPAGVTLAARRIPSGGCGTLNGGLSYMPLSDQGKALFSGAGDCADIALQLRVQGLSIQQAPGSYGTTVLYTVN